MKLCVVTNDLGTVLGAAAAPNETTLKAETEKPFVPLASAFEWRREGAFTGTQLPVGERLYYRHHSTGQWKRAARFLQVVEADLEGCTYDCDSCKEGGAMNEREAAARLCELLNEIEEAGIAVQITRNFGVGYHLSLGDGGTYLMEPPCEGEPWEAVTP